MGCVFCIGCVLGVMAVCTVFGVSLGSKAMGMWDGMDEWHALCSWCLSCARLVFSSGCVWGLIVGGECGLDCFIPVSVYEVYVCVCGECCWERPGVWSVVQCVYGEWVLSACVFH